MKNPHKCKHEQKLIHGLSGYLSDTLLINHFYCKECGSKISSTKNRDDSVHEHIHKIEEEVIEVIETKEVDYCVVKYKCEDCGYEGIYYIETFYCPLKRDRSER